MPRPIPMKSLQVADHLLGWLACVALQPLRALDALRPRRDRPLERILLVKFWGVGSLQLLTPAAESIRRRHPEAELTLLTLAENEPFARGLGIFHDIETIDVRTGWPGVAGRILSLFARIRQRRFDGVYDFEFFTRFSAILCFTSGAPLRVGFHAPRCWRGGAHTQTVPFNRYWHVARNFRALAGGESGREVAHEEILPFRPDAQDEQRAADLVASLPPGRPLVVLNPNAGSLSLERRWPAERYAQLAARLVREDGVAVVFVGAPSERPYVEAILTAAREPLDGPERERILCAAGVLDLGGLCALLQRADAVVSNDSGPMHLASALGRPTLGLFGPETPVMYRPLGARAEYLWDPPICSPCINVHDNKRATCIHGRPECLMNLELEHVLERTRRMLEGRNAPVAIL